MVAFLFWNIPKKSSAPLIAQACRDNQIDILILAESQTPPAALLSELNSQGGTIFYQQPRLLDSLAIFLRLPPKSMIAIFDNDRFSIQRVAPPIGSEMIVAACHLPSKLYSDPEDQSYNLRRLRKEIAAAEAKEGHQNTVVIGDLNLNPYDPGLRAVDGMHAVMDKKIALRKPKRAQGQEWDYFYNPMWSRLGDESVGPPGTYYHSIGNISPYWHMLDQVLLRPSLLPFYKHQNLKILTEIGTTSLVGATGPDKKISDHLPVVMKLETEKETESE